MAIEIKINVELSRFQRKIVRSTIVTGAIVASFGIATVIAAPIDTTWVSAGATLSAEKLKADLDGLQAQLTALQAAVVPSGTVVAFAGPVAPAGWAFCDGSALNRTSYPALFAAIGTSSGYGDNATTFNVPDYRGLFLRGTDRVAGNSSAVFGSGVTPATAAMNDPESTTRTAARPGGSSGQLVGSLQADQLASHTHSYAYDHTDVAATHSYDGGPYPIGALNATTGATGGLETRPKNVAVTYIIKL